MCLREIICVCVSMCVCERDSACLIRGPFFLGIEFVRIVFFWVENAKRVLRFISCSVINKSELFTIRLATELFYIKMKKTENFWRKN